MLPASSLLTVPVLSKRQMILQANSSSISSPPTSSRSSLSCFSNQRMIFYLFCFTSILAVAKADNEINNQSIQEGIAYEAFQQLALLNHDLNLILQQEQPRQSTATNSTPSVIPAPCSCDRGICKCCMGLLQLLGLHSCTEIVYRPDEFSFELRLRVNNNVLFKRKVSGQNPPPFCIQPPRFSFARACVRFSDIWFLGRNMHACMHASVSFQGFELFERDFDCLLFGDQGVKILKPEVGYPVEVDIGSDEEEIEDYDENVVRNWKYILGEAF